MRKALLILALLGLLAGIVSQTPSVGVATAQQGYEASPIQTVTLAYHDPYVYGDQYIDDRGVVDEWTAPNDVAVIGSQIYIEVYPIWRPSYNEGVIDGDVELSHNAGQANGTMNKADLSIVLGVEPGSPTASNSKTFAWGNFVERSTVMYPAGTAVILDQGEKLSLVADGRNHLMSSGNAVAIYYRAYVFYVNLN